MPVPLELVKEVRKRTGASMKQAKEVLAATGNDLANAVACIVASGGGGGGGGGGSGTPPPTAGLVTNDLFGGMTMTPSPAPAPR